VEDAIGSVREVETQLHEELRASTEDLYRLRGQLAESFRALARARLAAMARAEVVGELDAAERSALAFLEERKRALADVADRQTRAAAAVQQARAERDACEGRVAVARDAVTALVGATVARVGKEADWLARKAAVEDGERVAAAAEQKAKQVEADRDAKRKPYEADPLFMYLWRAGFGTAAYAAGPFVRFFDRQVARLIGFEGARPNYAMLNEIPLRLREHANRRQAELADAQHQLEAMERRALEVDGIAPLEEAFTTAKAGLDAAKTALADAEASQAATDRDQAALTAADDSNGPQARVLDALSEAIAGEAVQTLYRDALATSTPEDDAIVKRIDETRRTIAAAEVHVAVMRHEAGEVESRRRDLEAVRDNRRHEDAEPGFDLVMRGIFDALFRAGRGGYGGCTGGGGFGGWGRGSWGSGGSWGGGGFRTGGSSGGGGFRTGGGF
jgi:hypothetical protein